MSFSEAFSSRHNGMAVVLGRSTRQRVRVALVICPRPLECRSRFFPAPLWHPPKPTRHLNSCQNGLQRLREVLYFRRVTPCPQLALTSIAGFGRSEEHTSELQSRVD